MPHERNADDLSEMVYSEVYEEYICKACSEMLMYSGRFRFCPYCGRLFKRREQEETQ